MIDAAKSDADGVITYTAVWAADGNNNGIDDEQDRFTVIFTDGVDGEQIFADEKTTDLEVGDKTPTFTGSLTRTGYVFAGWTPSLKGNIRAEDAKNSADKLTITYTATWKDDKNDNDIPDEDEEFTVVYKDGAAELGKTAGLRLGADTPRQADPEKKDFAFTGWDPAVQPKVRAEDADADSVITYTATWKELVPITYPDADIDDDGDGKPDDVTEEVPTGTKIQVDPNGGSWKGSTAVQTITVTEKFDELKTEPVKEGYAFAGWKKTDGVDGIRYVFTAQWKPCTPISSWDAVDEGGKPVKHDPPVKKVVKGDKPATNDTFVFEFKAVGNTAGLAENPMPAGSDGQVKRVSLKAGEEYEFGEMLFTMPGTYEYVITEVNNHLAGYTYDTTVYTVTYIVEQEGDSLKATRLFRKDGKDVSIAAFEFNNTYKTPVPSPTPKTGDSENLVLWLNLLIGSLLALIAALRGKKRLYAR